MLLQHGFLLGWLYEIAALLLAHQRGNGEARRRFISLRFSAAQLAAKLHKNSRPRATAALVMRWKA